MLGQIKNGEKIVATRVVENFWGSGHKVIGLTASDLLAETVRQDMYAELDTEELTPRQEYDREVRGDMLREAKLDADRD